MKRALIIAGCGIIIGAISQTKIPSPGRELQQLFYDSKCLDSIEDNQSKQKCAKIDFRDIAPGITLRTQNCLQIRSPENFIISPAWASAIFDSESYATCCKTYAEIFLREIRRKIRIAYA